MAIAVYCTSAAGTKYRVYGCSFSAGKHEQRPIGDPAARQRIFVLNGGMKRSYTFRRGD